MEMMWERYVDIQNVSTDRKYIKEMLWERYIDIHRPAADPPQGHTRRIQGRLGKAFPRMCTQRCEVSHERYCPRTVMCW
jgi:hypothetical protein